VTRSTVSLITVGIAAIALLAAFQFIGGSPAGSAERAGLPLSAQTSAAAPEAGTTPAPVTRQAAAPGPAPATAQSSPAGAAGVQRFVIVPEQSTVTYRVAETFFREGNRLNTAVGVTKAVRGEVRVNRADPRLSSIGSITVDISQFRSDSERRDQAIRDRWLESTRFPTAQFTPTSISGLPSTYREGQELQLRITGSLKVRDVVRPVAFDAVLKVSGNTLTGTAKTAVKMTDFGFDPPSILGILRAENDVALEFAITARAQ
jgi:polyisoprenoid-binding protein YceI